MKDSEILKGFVIQDHELLKYLVKSQNEALRNNLLDSVGGSEN